MLRHFEPDVVVMDIGMPGMGGVEATRTIKSMRPQLTVIGLSMHEEQDLREAMLAAGASDYVTKGGPVSTLIDTIRERAE